MARIAFCQDVLIEFMGYMSMSAVLKEHGHTVEVFFDDQTNDDKFIAELAAFQPDVVGFSVLSPTESWALNIAGRAKQAIDCLTVFGNVHAIFNQDLIERPEIDILCIGDGEFPLLELASRLDKGEAYDDIPSLHVKTDNGIVRNAMGDLVDINQLPFNPAG